MDNLKNLEKKLKTIALTKKIKKMFEKNVKIILKNKIKYLNKRILKGLRKINME
jgi:hypothetical protein